jgi:hypothetical protein
LGIEFLNKQENERSFEPLESQTNSQKAINGAVRKHSLLPGPAALSCEVILPPGPHSMLHLREGPDGGVGDLRLGRPLSLTLRRGGSLKRAWGPWKAERMVLAPQPPPADTRRSPHSHSTSDRGHCIFRVSMEAAKWGVGMSWVAGQAWSHLAWVWGCS